MGPEYVSDLNHTNTLRELNKKLPLFMRVKWTECAGRIISHGSRPKLADFLQHLKDRAALVNNEFGEDLTPSPSKVQNGRIHKVEVLRNGLHYLEVSKVRKGLANRARNCQLVVCVAVNTDCGSVTNLRISLIKTNGRWCGTKTFVSSVYIVNTLQETAPKLSSNAKWMDATRVTAHYCIPLQKIRALQALMMAS